MTTLSVALLATILAAVAAYYAFPQRVAESLIRIARRKAGLTIKKAQVADHILVYLEGGSGAETIVLLHGFAGNKDHWLAFAPLLKDYHLVIPDLPGHGESSKREDSSYATAPQIDRLHDFLRQLQIGRFHGAGNSMGGMFAAAYAAQFPEEVISVGLFNAAGVKSPKPSEADEMLGRGENPLMLETEADYDRLARLAFFKLPFAPYPLRRMSIRSALANNAFNTKMQKEIGPEALALEADLPKILARTLLVWGVQDRILDVSGVAVFESGLNNCKTVLLDNCGHVPMIEKPLETANAYLAFLKEKVG